MSRKRPVEARVFEELGERLGQIEDTLQTLLKLLGTQHVPTLLNKSRMELKPTLGDCLRILLPIAHDWKTIGTLLGVEHHTLDIIKRDNIGISKDCLRDMLHQWLDRVSPPPTWEELAEAVEDTEYQTIAHKIRKISYNKKCSLSS